MQLDFSQIPSRRDYYWDGVAMVPVPDYARDEAAALRVLDKLREKGITVDIIMLPDGVAAHAYDENGVWLAGVTAESLAVAICAVALLAVGVKLPIGEQNQNRAPAETV